MTVLTVVTDTVKIFLLCQDIKYNKLRNKKVTTSVHRQGLQVPTDFSVYMEKKIPPPPPPNYKTVSLIHMLAGGRSEICEGFNNRCYY